MKILKLYRAQRSSWTHYYVIFDEIPRLTYEKIGADYIGSACMDDGTVIFSEFLKKGHSGAFAGRTIPLTMKDGSVKNICDYWWDNGPYPAHGEFVSIGSGTISDLQQCYVYCSMNIAKAAFEKMLEEYFRHDHSYEYYELQDWVFLQHTWYPVIIDGKPCGLMVNKVGQFLDPNTQKQVYCRNNIIICRYRWAGKTDREFYLYMFRWQKKNGERIERNLKQIYRASLPHEIGESLIGTLEGASKAPSGEFR